MQITELHTPTEVENFLGENPMAIIFKAGSCHKTMQGFGNIERLLRDQNNVPIGVIRVIENRSASNYVANLTNIIHHSPQIILFQQGQALFDLDNWNITTENLKPLFDKYLNQSIDGAKQQLHRSNLDNYINLIDRYLEGKISESDFQFVYLNNFRDDATLRAQEEFDLLNSLFGNPDEHHIHPNAIMSLEMNHGSSLYQRAQTLRKQLAEYLARV